MSTGLHQVPVRYARALVRGVEARGVPAARLFADESDVETLDRLTMLDESMDPDRRFPAALFGRLYHRATILLDDESLGLVSRGRVPRGAFRLLCHSLLDCADVAAIVARAADFMSICRGTAVRPVLHTGEHGVEIRMEALPNVCNGEGREERDDGIVFEPGPVPEPVAPDTRFAMREAARVRTTLYFWWNLLGWFAGRRLPLDAVSFAMSPPHHGDRWSDLFAAPVQFGEPWTALHCQADIPTLANVQHAASLEAFLRTAPLGLILPDVRVLDVEARVLAILADARHRDWPSAAETATRLNLSASSLHRQLREADVTFQQLKDRVRCDTATRLLARSSLPLAEIAYRVGYDDAAAFARAFRRWTGTSPGAYRAERLSGTESRRPP